MATKNDITGDFIKSKPASDQFDRNFDQIDWSVKMEKLEEVIKDHEELLKDLKDWQQHRSIIYYYFDEEFKWIIIIMLC